MTFAKHMSDKRIILKLYKELSKIKTRKTKETN